MYRLTLRLSLVGTILFVALWASVGGTQTPSTNGTSLWYRRCLAPIKHFDLWPFGEGNYLPYSRSLFEDWVSQLENFAELPDDDALVRVVLQARLEGRQLVDGRGFFDFRDSPPLETEDSRKAEYRRFPLTPLGIWISSPKLEEGTEAAISQTSTGEFCLAVPEAEFRQAKTNRVRFQWSLRGTVDKQGPLLFDFQLPRCLSVEIQLDLPLSMVPSSPVGIILEDEDARTEDTRRWRILLGGNSKATVSLSFDKHHDTSLKTAARQLVLYSLSPQGMIITNRIYFDKADPSINELQLELEGPLQPTGVFYGDQPVSYSLSLSEGDAADWRILIDLSDVEKNDQRELSITAQSPLSMDRLWELPRVRILSANVFWQETHAMVVVQRPLLANKLLANRAMQVTPVLTVDQTEQEVFAFQYFDADSQLAIEVDYFSSETTIEDATQILWGNSEIKGDMTLDVSLSEGDLYTLDFPVTDRWTIYSVKSLSGDDIRSWDILDEKEADDATVTPKDKILTIILKRPLRPREGIRLQISGRFYPAASQQEFPLTGLIPLARERKKNEQHFIALNSEAPYQFKYVAPTNVTPDVRNPLDYRLRARFAEPPFGTVFSLDSLTQGIRVSLEPLKPSYSVEITANVLLKEDAIIPQFRFLCQPTDSVVERLYVHFTAGTPESWYWDTGDESSGPLQARKLFPTEIEELFPPLGQKRQLNELQRGETWELRLSAPQSHPFEIRATATIPVSRSAQVHAPPIPLAYFPLASSQKAEMVIESPRESFYQIVNHRLTSIPIAAPDWNRYQTILAAFRYDPYEEAIFSAEPPLFLIPRNSQDVPAAAWAWALRLDSQFEAEGVVRNTAHFLIENRGKDVLRITLPDGVLAENVLAVWIDDVNTLWTQENGTTGKANILGITLPEGKRFISVSLEYSFKDKPLTRQRKLYPRYPAVDIPVLSGNWTSWLPPEYDVYPKTNRESLKFSLTLQALDGRFTTGPFNPFSHDDWNLLLTKRQRREQAVAASKLFFTWIGRGLTEFETKTILSGAPDIVITSPMSESRPVNAVSEQKTPTWGTLLNDERLLAELLTSEPGEEFQVLRRSGRGPVRVTVRMDRRAIAALDVFPSTPVVPLNSANAETCGADAFKRAGLVLLVCPWKNQNGEFEVVFYITSFLSAAINTIPYSEHIDNGVRFLPFTLAMEDATNSSLSKSPSPTLQTGPPRWSDLEQWANDAPTPLSPWSISPQIIRLATITPNWNAFEMSRDEFASPLYIVHRKTLASYYWLAFLTAIVLTWRKPFSSPILLFLLLIVFEVVTRAVSPCFRSIPSGAFLGALVSLGFALVRRRVSTKPGRRLRERTTAQQGSTALTLRESPSDIRDFEINPGPFVHESSPSSLDEKKSKRNSPSENGRRRRGSTSGLLFYGVLFFTLIVFFKSDVIAETTPTEHEITGKKSQQERVEPYRVFFPIDDQGRIVDDDIWLTDEFLRLMQRQLQVVKPRSPQLWSINSATYLGSLAYNPTTQSLDLASLKAVYEISLDTESATIRFPNLPIPPDGAKWDNMPIQPSGQADNSLVFNVDNQEKGVHRLELTLMPSTISRDNTRRVSLDIPKVPNALFRLTVPPDAPPVTIHDSHGTVTPHSIAMPTTTTAEIGPSEKLTFSWLDEPGRNDRVAVEVDQLFRLRVRSGPVDAVELRTVFRYRIDGGKIRQIQLQTDPRWQLSGQFKCSEASIEQVESAFIATGPDSLTTPRCEVTRLTFKSPVSGFLTVEADFVLKDFSGIGHVRLPQISAFQTKISQSMLAVSRDSAIEFDLPEAPRAVGFESILEEIMGGARNISQASKPTNSLPITEDRPLITYDLTKTDPSWTLPIRTKKRLPTLRLNHAVLFDYTEAVLNVTAQFSTTGEVFQQTFLAPECLDIESIDVRDARDSITETRWVKSKHVRTIDGVKLNEYILFSKRALLGEYLLVISGRFPTNPLGQDGARRREAGIPLILFEDVLYEEQLLNLFRSRSVIVDRPTITGGQPGEMPLEPPTEFADAALHDTWKSTTDPMATGKWELAEQLNFSRRLPTWTIVLNEPVVRGCQITTMLPSRSGDGWELTTDFDWDISDGELETIRLHWDDQCGSPTHIEPTIPWKLERKQGLSQLVLLPNRPLSGQQRFQIQAPYNFTGNTVAFPNVSINQENKDQSEITQYVILPTEWNREVFVWDWKMLTPLDEALTKEVAEKVEALLENRTNDGKKNETTSVPQTAVRLFLKVSGENATVSIASQNNRPQATLYDVGLFIRNNGRIYGTATIDIQGRGHDGFVLRLPENFEIVQVVCAGIASKGTRLSELRWRIDLWTDDYPQRIVVIFKGELPPETNSSMETLFDRLGSVGSVLNLPIPYLEGIEVRETLWTLSFESTANSCLPRMAVTVRRELSENDSLDGIDEVGIGRPIAGMGATATQLRLNLARLSNLLTVLESVPTPLPDKTAEVERWTSHWAREWWSIKKMTEFQIGELTTTETEESASVLTAVDPAKRSLRAAIEPIVGPQKALTAMQLLERQALVRLGYTYRQQDSERAFPLPTNSLVLWGDSLTGRTTHLFGLCEGQLKELSLETLPDSHRFMQRFPFDFWFRVIPLVVIPFVLWNSKVQEIFRRFPHFGGLALGAGIWIIHPSGLFGAAVILLTLFSFAHPPWKSKKKLRREEG